MAYILITDDDPEVLGTVWRALSREDHEIDLAESAQQAKKLIDRRKPDLLILDIMMANKDGLTFCRELRSEPQYNSMPILFISAKWTTDEVVEGLDAGGDDYLTKPFELKELNARVRALLRRQPPDSDNTVMVVGDLQLDRKTFQVSVFGEEGIQLTSTEFRLLEHLMLHDKEAHSVHHLLDKVWGYPPGTGDPDLVRAHIRNLRAKIEPDASSPQLIQTIHGVGYMIKGQ